MICVKNQRIELDRAMKSNNKYIKSLTKGVCWEKKATKQRAFHCHVIGTVENSDLRFSHMQIVRILPQMTSGKKYITMVNIFNLKNTVTLS